MYIIFTPWGKSALQKPNQFQAQSSEVISRGSTVKFGATHK